MITLITGLPGNGKTLYALAWVKAKAEKENRPVYYSGIADLKLPWIECDPQKWFELPSGAIIVIDECQRVFRPRMHGTQVPEFVARLETHRHQGVDIVLITQHPMLVDSNVRRLVGQHFHVVRKFGAPAATVHEWNVCRENCDKVRNDSVRHEFIYPKEVYTWYKSAEVHTHKMRIPMRVWILGLVPIVLGVAVYVVYSRMQARIDGEGLPQRDVQVLAEGPRPAGTAAAGGGATTRREDRPMTTAEYLAIHQPRVPGLLYTAPVYDEVTKPVEAPYPAACVRSATRCQCYTQQATRMELPPGMCESIADGGFFLAWSRSQPQQSQAQSGAVQVVSHVVEGPTGASLGGSPPPHVIGGGSRGDPR